MNCKVKIIDDRIIIDCNNCINNASIGNENCIKTIIKNMNSKTKEAVFIKNEFKKAYSNIDLLYEFKKLNVLNPIKEYVEGNKDLSKTKLIKLASACEEKEISKIYHKLFPVKVMPGFANSEVLKVPFGYKLIESYEVTYSRINIYKKGLKYIYEVVPVEFNLTYEEVKKIINALNTISKRLDNFDNMDFKISSFINELKIDSKLKEIVARYSYGFGLLDILFMDDFIQDVFVDSPSKDPIHIIHTKYGECVTNLVLSKSNLNSIITRIRALSGRPFDEGFPVIHYNLKNKQVRVCGIREPLTYEGIGFAFRKHRTVPWTLTDFVLNGMISLDAAGLISYLVDGQVSILITGPRGAGKTSLLSALISEIPKNQRIIVIEDTPELPIKTLKNAGFKIEHLRVKPFIKDETDDFELSPEQALRTALRLGESVLIIGEVRGPEAKALFEAMRVGASGNVVLGTIHGSSPYDTYDRIVNDLKVPRTSFKAADIILTCANLRIGESTRRIRKLVGITEIRKNWTKDPFKENGLFELCSFGRDRTLKLNKNIRKSEILNKISELKGISISDALRSIKIRAKAKELIIKNNLTGDYEFQIACNEKLTEFLSESYTGTIKKFQKWLLAEKKNLLKTKKK